ncbi:C45 family peptidase [Mangrovimonas sp. DI 80]|uniref:C45 family autoproteolytic acyltransferase/hydolase n=1 Tax=Mangrovimonas sp. DI 80 TaxID=1779330 RepID=UPI000976669D|nr:C45 family peptidase [Mangrovimonas sp. DI 80]OMP31459.1 acyl-CoA--6-aminopenicillanic acid acyl-transferase [Mangrovimonas sp. DI 80]
MVYKKGLLALNGLMLVVMTSCGVSKSLHDIPNVSSFNSQIPDRQKIADTLFVAGTNRLMKNQQGLWELSVGGNPYQLGMVSGSLTQELFEKQEEALLGKVEEMVPSKFKQYMLRKILAWYNRKMYLHVPEEYKVEILGLSKYAGDTYDYVADDYLRILYLHGAHDIGHAFQDLALVGCSSFAVWGKNTEDGNLVIGRNFDFYAGDEFSENKLVAFVNPINGYKFMSVTWAGMIGVVSGMNEKGLTVTINAGKSKVPMVAKTPISIVTREILQYASTIEEAIAIAKKREVFVSESIFVGSAADNKAVTIEVSPENFGVYEVPNSEELICANHFQSEAYANDEDNLKHIAESHSMYRYQRMEELLNEAPKVSPEVAVDILRNKEGLDDELIGYGNEKSLNQLLAHHGIVFQPSKRLVWVSAPPYQLGAFVAYDLDEVFAADNEKTTSLQNEALMIEADDFLYTEAYANYEKYRVLSRSLADAIQNDGHLEPELLLEFQKSNPNYWETYYLLGQYYYGKKYYTAGQNAFEKALSKEISTVPYKQDIQHYIKKIKRQLQ